MDAFSVGVNKASMEFGMDSETNIAGTKTTTSMKASVDDFSFKVAAKGLTSKLINDVQASVTASAKLTSEMTGGLLNQTGSNTNTESSLAFGAYLYQNNFYVDVSNSTLYSMLSSFMTSFGGTTTATLAPKFYTPAGIKDEDLPVINDVMDGLEKSKDDENINIEGLSVNPDTGVFNLDSDFYSFYTYNNGDYAILAQFSEEDLKKVLGEANTLSSSFSGLIGNSQIDNASSVTFENSKFDYIMYFTKSGISYVGLTSDLKMSFTSNTNDDTLAYSTKTTISFKTNFKVEFKYGKNVVVDTPKVADYTLLENKK